jgi:anti-sigma-K factor RskA
MSGPAHVHELLGGYVLGALEPQEMSAIDRHLETCPECRREHAELAGVPALLEMLDTPDTAPGSPPPQLEEAVLDRFARERRMLTPRQSPRRRTWAVRLAVAGAAAAAAAALALAGVFSTSEESSAFGHARLRGDGPAVANADLRAIRAGTGVRMSVSGLPGGRSRVYELWCVTDRGRWISGGTFRVDRRGHAQVSLTSAARPGEYERMLVTRHAGGARGPRILSGAVEY